MRLPYQIELLRELADGLFKIADVDIPYVELESTIADAKPEDRNWQDWDQNGGWVEACNEVLSILSNMEGEVSFDEEIQQETVEPGEDNYWFVDFYNRNDFAVLSCTITTWGDNILLAEYDTINGRGILWEGKVGGNPPSIPEVMLTVASGELALLTSQTGSCKVALDYWQTEMSPREYTQKDWSEIRGVGRQTVNDSVRSARNNIDSHSRREY